MGDDFRCSRGIGVKDSSLYADTDSEDMSEIYASDTKIDEDGERFSNVNVK